MKDFNPQKIIPIRKHDPTDYAPLWREAYERKKKQFTNKYKFIKGNIYERQGSEHCGQIPGTLPEQNGAPDIEAERTGHSGKDQAPDRKQNLANGGKNIGSERTLVRIKENAAECRGIFKGLAYEPVQSVIGNHIRRNFARIAGSVAAGIASLAGKVIRRALGGIFQEIGRLPESTAKRRRRLAIRTAAITDITVDERFSGNVGDRWRAGLPEMVVSYCGSDEKKLHVVFTVEGYRNADALEWFGELQNKLMNHISVSIDPGDGCLAFFK